MNPKSFVDLANEISFDVHLIIFCILSTLSLVGFAPVPMLLTGSGAIGMRKKRCIPIPVTGDFFAKGWMMKATCI